MSHEDIRKLLGGYATGTLTPEEQQALFEAALTDQELFDALALEQPLHDLLRDPAARGLLLSALDEQPVPWYQRWGWRPAAAVLAMASLVTVAVVALQRARAPKPVILADVRSLPARPVAPSQTAPPPAAEPSAEAPKTAGQPTRLRRLDSAPSPTKPDVPAAPAAAPPPVDSLGSLRDVTRNEAKKEVQTETAANAPRAAVASPNARALFYATPAQLPEFSGALGGGRGGTLQQRFQQQQPQQAAPSPGGPRQQEQLSEKRNAAPVAPASPMAKVSAALQVANPGVRYRFLRKITDGEFAEANPDSLTAGDTVEIEFTPNDAGYLLVSSGNRPVLAKPVERLKPYTTEPLLPGDRELTVVFSQPETADTKDQPSVNLVQAQSAATYVVGSRAAQPVRFTITLNYK